VKIEKKMKIVLDCANENGGLIAPYLHEKYKCEIVKMNCEPDGRFPAHVPEPKEETMKELEKKVVEVGADFGACYDCDGDRCCFVDEKGRFLPTSKTAIIMMEDIFQKTESPRIVYDVGSSLAIREFIEKKGGVGIESKTGHTFFIEKMINEGMDFGCERSSHLYFSETNGFDDGIFATLKMAEILSNSNKTLSQLADQIPDYPYKQENFRCEDKIKFEVVDRLKNRFSNLNYKVNTIDGIKAYDKDGWVLIRASNTEPLIRIIAEARSEDKLKEIFDLGAKLLKEEIGNYYKYMDDKN